MQPLQALSGDVVYLGLVVLAMNGALAAPGDENWDGRFRLPGLNGPVKAMAVRGSDLYCGGGFNFAGGTYARSIARWDGTNWFPLGSGVDDDSYSGTVSSILLRGHEVIVGGRFTHAGGVLATNVARWDGTNWTGLGRGLVHQPSGWGGVHALASAPDFLYAAGFFTHTGDKPVSGLAKWDGAQWSAVGGNPPLAQGGYFNALAVMGRDLYAGGDVLFAPGAGGSYLARWDGTNWSGLGSGLTNRESQHGYGSVNALATLDKDLYAAGWFDTAGGQPAAGVARWDGRNWWPLGSGVTGRVSELAMSGGELCAAGNFTMAGAKPAGSFSLWHIPPRLEIRRLGAEVEISWPAQAVGCALQSTTNLPSANWINTRPPGVSGQRHVLIETPGAASGFYRLQR